MSSKQRRSDSPRSNKNETSLPNHSISKQEIENLKEKTIQLILKDPSKAAVILTSWLSGKNPSPSKQKK